MDGRTSEATSKLRKKHLLPQTNQDFKAKQKISKSRTSNAWRPPRRKVFDRKSSNLDKSNDRNMGAANWINAGLYVLSGCIQPLLMTQIKESGLGDSSAQIYMVFYYLAPASVVIQWFFEKNQSPWPSKIKMLQAVGIATWDIASTSLNYTGASLAGPTIFAIVYSSVTVWTAIFSKCLLGRSLNWRQWAGISIVFGGLTITASDSMDLGPEIIRGLSFVLVGSAMHGMTYVLSEGIMTKGGQQSLTVAQNCAIQGIVACTVFLFWQLVYTLPRFDELVEQPMRAAHTSPGYGWLLMMSFCLANLVHSLTFYHTLLHFIGGATSAGVMKALQAVLVFVFTDVVYCGQVGGSEMCFTYTKFVSLVTVVGGVSIFGSATQKAHENGVTSREEYVTIKETHVKPETVD